jgi:hypothetical protein
VEAVFAPFILRNYHKINQLTFLTIDLLVTLNREFLPFSAPKWPFLAKKASFFTKNGSLFRDGCNDEPRPAAFDLRYSRFRGFPGMTHLENSGAIHTRLHFPE